jgi:hypothetical protein
MGVINSKNSLREARYHKHLKGDMLIFLSRVNNISPITDKDVIITQAEVLMTRSSNYFTKETKNIPFLNSQIPPPYEQENAERKLSDVEFREYIKRVCFYFQYFLECV